MLLRLLSRHHGGLSRPRMRPCRPMASSPSPLRVFPRRNATSSGQSQSPPPDLPSWAAAPRWRRVLGSIVVGIKLVAFAHLFVSKFLIVSQCEGASMVPTLPGTVSTVIVNHLYSRGRGVKVGDMITAHRPDDMDIMMLKRVIGMPGDYVVMDPMAAGLGEETMMVRVPDGHCWITGDNLTHSIDSRFYGPLPLALVMGKVIAQVSMDRWTWYTENQLKAVPPGE